MDQYTGICVGGPWHGRNVTNDKNRMELSEFKPNREKVEYRFGLYVLEDIQWTWRGWDDEQ